MFELISASMIRSGVAEYKQPFILSQDFTPNFPLRLMHKDIHLMLDAGKENDVKLPGLTKIDEIYEEASKAGYDDLDYASTIMLLEEWANLRIALENLRSGISSFDRSSLSDEFICTRFISFFWLGHELIAQPSHGDQVPWLGRVIFDISRNLTNKIVNRASVRVFVQVPDFLQDFFASQQAFHCYE